jgi:hypothetical protein
VHKVIYKSTYRCLKIREYRIQSIVGDHFSSPDMEIKKSGLPPQRFNNEKLLTSRREILLLGLVQE